MGYRRQIGFRTQNLNTQAPHETWSLTVSVGRAVPAARLCQEGIGFSQRHDGGISA